MHKVNCDLWLSFTDHKNRSMGPVLTSLKMQEVIIGLSYKIAEFLFFSDIFQKYGGMNSEIMYICSRHVHTYICMNVHSQMCMIVCIYIGRHI